MSVVAHFQPALLGGLVMGVLSALPIVSAGNVCCCLWVVSGGLLAAYLLQQNRPDAITAADGAVVGLLAGIFGAVIQFVLSVPIGLLVGPVERQMLERLREMSGSMAPGVEMNRGGGALGVVVLRILAFFFTLIVGSAVSTVAGLVGAALFARRTPPFHRGRHPASLASSTLHLGSRHPASSVPSTLPRQSPGPPAS